jgi:uncharacterized protein (DUF488 family)
MSTSEFAESLNRLIARASEKRTAIMCAEAVPWKCHRSVLSDSLLAHGVRVVHILGPGKTQEHRSNAVRKGPRDSGHISWDHKGV